TRPGRSWPPGVGAAPARRRRAGWQEWRCGRQVSAEVRSRQAWVVRAADFGPPKVTCTGFPLGRSIRPPPDEILLESDPEWRCDRYKGPNPPFGAAQSEVESELPGQE